MRFHVSAITNDGIVRLDTDVEPPTPLLPQHVLDAFTDDRLLTATYTTDGYSLVFARRTTH